MVEVPIDIRGLTFLQNMVVSMERGTLDRSELIDYTFLLFYEWC
jgi:hypothetical protein